MTELRPTPSPVASVEAPAPAARKRRPWGLRVNRVLFGVIGAFVLWNTVQVLAHWGDVDVAPQMLSIALALVIAVVGLVALEIVLLSPFGRYPVVPGLPPRWASSPAVAVGVVALAAAATTLRELGLVTVTVHSSEFQSTYVTRNKVDGTIPPMLGAVACEIRCHGGDACDGMSQQLERACDRSAPDRLVIDLWLDDPFCYVPLVKRLSVEFTALVAIHAGGLTTPTGHLHFEGRTEAQVRGVVSCKTARQITGNTLALQLIPALTAALAKPDDLMRICTGGLSIGGTTTCEDHGQRPWSPPSD